MSCNDWARELYRSSDLKGGGSAPYADDTISHKKANVEKQRPDTPSNDKEDFPKSEEEVVYWKCERLETKPAQLAEGDEVFEEKKNKKSPSKKSKKRYCDHNNFHDADGKFSTKGNATSFSNKDTDDPDCHRGAAQMPSHKWVKLPCGAIQRNKDRPPTHKHPYRCKGGDAT